MKKIYQFQKNDAISFNDTTREQRQIIHRLIEKRGYDVSVTADKRDKHYTAGAKGVWDSHFAFEFDRMEWRAVSIGSYNRKNLIYYSYEWWYEKLAYIIDNSDSAINTILDEQLKLFNHEE